MAGNTVDWAGGLLVCGIRMLFRGRVGVMGRGETTRGLTAIFQKFSRSDNSMVRGGVVPVLVPQLTVLLTGMLLFAVRV